MSRFRHVELQYASRLLNHGPTILITSYDAPSDRRNVMAAAWSMPVEFAPPRVAIVVDKSTWTREIIERNGTFGIVVPGVAAASWTYAQARRRGGPRRKKKKKGGEKIKERERGK
ncbi:flavin reductase, partial [Klebsiella pneumoniae]|uniref:flavin reductase family protein n=1 Tax=Klebsiella pneumoniae TaxID=573 RepID=UPI002181F038